MKIRTTKFQSLASDYYDYGGCGLTRAQVQDLKSRNFLLKGWEPTPRNFAPVKLPHCM